MKMLLLIPLAILLVCPSVMPSTDVGDGNVCKLTIVDDVWVDNTTSNHDGDTFLSIGKRAGTKAKRALLKFQYLSNTDCAVKKIRWAKLYMYYEKAYRDGGQSVTVAKEYSYLLEVHALKNAWVEGQVTGKIRQTDTNWGAPMLEISKDIDAEVEPQASATTIFASRAAGFVEFDVTRAVRHWADNGSSTNKGIVVLATNEGKAAGTDLRFTSDTGTAAQRAYINVMCDY